MSASYARQNYQNANRAYAPETDDPHELVQLTLNELHRSLNVMVTAEKQGTSHLTDHIRRSVTAIYILQSSLDFERGGEIAEHLFRVYEYCRQQVLKRFRDEDDADLGSALEAIGGIVEAWREMGNIPATDYDE